jgi:hypothetical protein
VKRNAYMLLALVLLIGMLAGCVTSRQSLILQDEPIKSAEAENLKVTVRFLDEPTLKAKFDERTNPFLTDYYTVQMRRIMVFDITVENMRSESVGLLSRRLEIQFGGQNRTPYNRFQLTNYWKVKDEDRDTRNIYRAQRADIINDWVLPNELTVAPGGKAKGYAVFLGNFPSYGTAVLYVPVLQAEQYVIHRFDFDYTF